tara:strand:- start:1251 stop:1634 length:384 start_codon:yes stop_codon:yes gene_type:complete
MPPAAVHGTPRYVVYGKFVSLEDYTDTYPHRHYRVVRDHTGLGTLRFHVETATVHFVREQHIPHPPWPLPTNTVWKRVVTFGDADTALCVACGTGATLVVDGERVHTFETATDAAHALRNIVEEAAP